MSAIRSRLTLRRLAYECDECWHMTIKRRFAFLWSRYWTKLKFF